MKVKISTFYYILIVVIILGIFSTIVFSSENISKYRYPSYYSFYDSQTFYRASNTLKLNDPDELFKYGEYSFAYLAYPKYLIIIHNIYSFLGIKEITYPVLVFSNILLLIAIYILYWIVFRPSRQIALLLLFPLLLEPSLLGFSLTLEREVMGSLFLALTALVFTYSKGIKKWIFFLILLYIGFNIRREIVLITLLSVIVFYILNFYNSLFEIKNKLILLGIVILLFIVFSISLYFYFGEEIDLRLNGLIANASTSGFGSTILSFPLALRFLSYFVLFFFAPIPITHIFNVEFLFPYEWFLLFSGISYLVLWIIILKNHAYIKRKEIFLIIMLFVSHFIFGSILFNIRHRTDIIVLMVCLVLIIIKNKLKKGFTVKYILNENLMILLIGIGLQIFLHSVYFIMKLI